MTILGEKIIEEIRRVAEESPDTQADCKYLDETGTPMCIVGVALDNLGLLGHFRDSYSNDDYTWNGAGIGDVDFGFTQRLSLEEISWLTDVQSAQDCNRTWGEAVVIAGEAAV